MTNQAGDGFYEVQKHDIARAGAVMKDAFRHDPVWNAMFAGEIDADRKLDAFFLTPLKFCRKYGAVAAVSENLEGVAGWVGGRSADMTPWRMLASGAMWSGLRMGMRFAMKMKTVFDPMQADRREHMKGREYIYLQILGVSSGHQRKGFGGRLLGHVIRKSEQSGGIVYLETETEGNVAWYEKSGFRVLQRITLPVIGLPMWEMVKD